MASKREEIIANIEESLIILNETLGHFSRLSIRNPNRKPLMDGVKKDIEWNINFLKKMK